jgi:hypothetical protein
MRSSIALSALVLMGTICGAQQSFLSDFEYALQQQGANTRIEFGYKVLPNDREKYSLVSTFRFGAGPALNGSNETEMNLAIDTRSQRSFVFDSNCTSCIVANKYSKNPNATTEPLNTN